MEPHSLIRAAIWLLSAAAVLGSAMAALRFMKDRHPPAMVSKVHGFLTCSAIALLVFGWATVGLPKFAALALVLLLVAAAGGLTLSQGWWRLKPDQIELLVFAHLSVAAAGYLLLLAA
jgi:hypothetical protein